MRSVEAGPWGEAGGPPAGRERNVAVVERVASALGGLGVAVWGLRRGGLRGVLATVAGGALLERGLTGHCRVYAALGSRTSTETRSPVASVAHGQGIRVERAVTIRRPAAELYDFWRDFQNLPRVMRHLESVEPLEGGRWRWVARAPMGGRVEWEAEIWNERPGELIAWRSLTGSDVDNAGSVQFRELPEGRGTEVCVLLEYRPPMGRVGAAVAALLGEDPDRQVRDDLERFKQLIEAGEAATADPSTSARESAGPAVGSGATDRVSPSGDPAGAAGEFPLDPSIFAPAEGPERPRRRRRPDLVQEASEESFPASDPPGWSAEDEDARKPRG